MTVGRSIANLNSGAFANCAMLKGFYCLTTSLPSVNSNCFGGSDPASITLYVPDESIENYSAVSPWSSFAAIRGLSQAPTYINSITLDTEVKVISDDPDDEYYIRASVLPANATNSKVTWTSSNTAIATVSRTGLVQPVAEGVATITCTASDRHGAHATSLVIVSNRFKPITSLSLDQNTLTLTEGERKQLVPTSIPTDATYDAIKWTSSDENIAIVSEAGIITALKSGQANIIATTTDGTSLRSICQLTIIAPANSNLSTRGDTDGNGWVSEDDMTRIADYLVGETTTGGNSMDINNDGEVSVADIMAVSAALRDASNVPSGPLKMAKIDATSYSLVVGGTRTVTTQVIPFRSGNHLDWTIDNTSLLRIENYYDGKCTIVALAPGRTTLTATANDGSGVSTSTTINIEPNYLGSTDGHNWVDLGLPSGTRWATANIGAVRQEDYGEYYAWGEKVTKETYDWTTYSLCNGSSTTLTKYCSAASLGHRDDKNVLEATDDVVKSEWGNNWATPTSAQLTELFNSNYTTTEWMEQSGVYGCKVTSKANGCSVFLPAAGYKNEFGLSSERTGGYYMSCNLTDTSTKFFGVNFGESSVTTNNESFRCHGMSVRPVLCPSMNLASSNVQLIEGETYSFAGMVSLDNAATPNLTWSSSNTDIATVTASGNVRALSIGSAIIYATDASGVTASINLTVNPLEVSVDNHVIKSGASTNANVNTTVPVTWSSGDTSIASVSADGVVTAVSDGCTTITCTLSSGVAKSVSIVVMDEIPTSIINTGAAKVNLNYVFTPNTRIETKVAFVQNNGGSVLGECDGSENDEVRFFMSGSSVYFDVKSGRIYTSVSGYQTPHIYELGNYYIKRDGSTICSSSAMSFTRSKSLYLFPVEGDRAEVYYIKVYEGSSLVREYIPAYKDGLCLFETQEGKYYIADNPQYLMSYELSSGSEGGHNYVDLGLPSGTLWATCNVGAETVEGYGNYYAWGETQPKSNFSWSTYSLCDNGSSSRLNKYCTSSSYGAVDNKTILDLSDDAANANWGGEWCMPTKEQQEELFNATYTTTSSTIVHGVNGVLITSKINNKTLFIPYAGYKNGTSSYTGNAYLWTRTLSTSQSAYCLNNTSTSSSSRFLGYSVRPVLLTPVTSITLPQSKTMTMGQMVKIPVTYTPTSSTGRKLLWTSSDESIATVSSEGIVTACDKAGTATITATSETGAAAATCAIEVINAITYPDWTSTNTADSSTSSYTYTIPHNSGQTLSFDWKVSSEAGYDKLIVTIDGMEVLNKSGELSGTYTTAFNSAGTTTVIVKYTKDGSQTDGSDKAWINNVKVQ